MDGGRILRSLLAFAFRDHYLATRIASWLGRILGGLLSVLGLINSLPVTIFLGIFLIFLAIQEGIHPGTELVEPKPKSI
jgi:Zn-dependent protease